MPDQPLKVLIVEDEDEVAQTIKDAIEEKVPSQCVIEESFERALAIAGPQFDVVVLDQMKGPPPKGDVGARPIWQRIYEDNFLPVVVYSAVELALPESFPEGNPILVYIAKGGQNSEEALANHLSSQKHIYLGLKHLNKELSQVIRDAFLKVAPVLVSPTPDLQEAAAPKEAKHFARAARRRIAAMMDLTTLAGDDLLAWEQYVYPPLSEQWFTGDILHVNGSPDDDPTSYRILLTPSCDLPRPPQGKGKVEHILVCKCVPFLKFIERAKAKQTKLKEFEKEMAIALNRAHVDGFLPLPSYHRKIPSMAAKLKALDLIPLAEIGGQEKKYTIVASIDSPFREQISWAFIEVLGRPGVPARDLNIWIKELWEELQTARAEE